MPTPIEDEDAEIVAPVLPPDAAEIQPRGADPLRAFAPTEPAETYSIAESESSNHEYVPDAPDPVRQLGASALSTASLEAAGAPTPRGGVPLISRDGDVVPTFGEEEPFVPRFEPFGGVVPSPVPTVSFTTPKPTTPLVSPLSDVAIPESDGPAYTPREEFLDTQLHSASGEDTQADATASDSPASPARPWAAVDPTEVEFVSGEPLSVEVGTFGAEAPAVTDDGDGSFDIPFTPTAPSWEGIIGGEGATLQTPAVYEMPVTVAPGRFPPVVDVAADAPDSEEAVVADAAADFNDDAPAVVAPDVLADVATDDFAPEPTGPTTEPEPEPSSDAEVDAAEDASSDAEVGEPQAAAFEIPTLAPVTPAMPISPVASFFAATATRSARRAEDASGATPAIPSVDSTPTEASTLEFAPPMARSVDETPTEAAAPESAPTEVFRSAPISKEPLRAEPVRTTATAYTPSTGAWAKPAFASADAVTQVNEMAPIGDAHDMGSTPPAGLPGTSPDPAASGESLQTEGKVTRVHKRRRLVLWIVLGAIVVAAAAFLVYRLYFLPEPIILPAPIATAQAPTPTAKPIEVVNASAFVTSMPTTVGTDVLMDYTVTDTVGDSTLPARTAEHVTLNYGPGSSNRVFTVDAYQHYNQTDAQTAYDSYATGMTDVKDVVVDGTTVGKRAYSTTGSKGTVVWRNGTSVFDLTGPANEVLGFFEHFGV